MIFIGSNRPRDAQPFKGLLRTQSQVSIRLHDGSRWRNGSVIARGDGQAFGIIVSRNNVQIVTGRIGQRHGQRSLINPLAPDNFPVGVLLQELHNRLGLQRQRPCNRLSLLFRIEGDKGGLSFCQQRFIIHLLHDIRRGELAQINSHSV